MGERTDKEIEKAVDSVMYNITKNIWRVQNS